MSHTIAAAGGDFAAHASAAAEKVHVPKKDNAMRRVFTLVGVAIAVFLAFTAYTVTKEIQGRAQLAAIKDLYFPVLQRLDADIVRIDKMEEIYIQVVVAGDRDLITKAADLSTQTDTALAQIDSLYPGKESGHRASASGIEALPDIGDQSVQRLSESVGWGHGGHGGGHE